MKTVTKKIYKEWFDLVSSGKKKYELRLDEFEIEEGDVLRLEEYNEKDRTLDFIIHKLFNDYQLNSFFSYDNVLTYGGYVNRRPEFLYNLAELLNLPNLEYDWAKNNKCYVIKFVTSISDHTDWNFINKSEFDYLDQEEIEIKKRKWMMTETLSNIYDGFFHDTVRDSFSYIRPTKIIPFSNCIAIYTDNEYLNTFGYDKK